VVRNRGALGRGTRAKQLHALAEKWVSLRICSHDGDSGMSSAAFGEDTGMRMEALRKQFQLPPLVPPEGVAVRHLRGATEYRGTRERLVGSGMVQAEWLPIERQPGLRTRATLRARDGGRDVFARRLDDGRYCVLVIHTQRERAAHDRLAFELFLRRLLKKAR